MKRTPCVTDATVAGTASPTAWNTDVRRPVKPFATIATSCAARIVTPIERTDRSATNAVNTWSRKRNTAAEKTSAVPPTAIAEARSAEEGRSLSLCRSSRPGVAARPS